MIITRTPYRVSFMGGGSDYREWYEQHGGCVLSTTIDKYCYLSLRRMPPFLGKNYRVFWSKMENVDTRAEIQHPAFRACLEYLGVDEPLELNHAGDLPARAGLGSSSACTVGVLAALHTLLHRYVPDKRTLANQAIEVEQKVLRETVGIQDQIACAYGGFNVVRITQDGKYLVRPIGLPASRLRLLEAHLMLVFTGLQRNASEIATEQVSKFGQHGPQMAALAGMVAQAVEILTGDGSLDPFGELLHDAWLIKRGLSALVSNETVDGLYARAIAAGALGGKLLGAGGGGFLLLYVRPQDQPAVRDSLKGFYEVPVRFETGGAQVVLNSDLDDEKSRRGRG